MLSYLQGRLALVWAGLVAATVLSLFVSREDGATSAEAAGALVLVIGFLKIWVIAREFMDLRSADRRLRLAVQAWTVVVCAVLVAVLVLR